ncbi:MAG: anti-sigma factor, partial [Planctomycetota bacterium]
TVLQSAPAASADTVQRAPAASPGINTRELFAWLAAAACLLLMVAGANPFATSPADPDPDPGQSAGVVQVVPLDQQLASFVAEAPDDLIRLDWAKAADDDVTGQVVWSDTLQKGFMIFEGLDVNDPSESQYQLWVFEDPDEVAPNDGGVFDIEIAEGKTIVPFSPPYRVESAAMFAITVEDPGGKYHSGREIISTVALVE